MSYSGAMVRCRRAFIMFRTIPRRLLSTRCGHREDLREAEYEGLSEVTLLLTHGHLTISARRRSSRAGRARRCAYARDLSMLTSNVDSLAVLPVAPEPVEADIAARGEIRAAVIPVQVPRPAIRAAAFAT